MIKADDKLPLEIDSLINVLASKYSINIRIVYKRHGFYKYLLYIDNNLCKGLVDKKSTIIFLEGIIFSLTIQM